MRNENPPSRADSGSDKGLSGAPAAVRRLARAANPLRRLRQLLTLFLITVGIAVAYALVDRSRRAPSPPLATLEAADGVTQRAMTLDATRTRRGLPSLRVRAGEALTFREGRTELRDVLVTLFDEDGRGTDVSAPLAMSGKGGSGGWTFKDGVELRTEDGVSLRVFELHYDEQTGEVSASGKVAFGKEGYEGTAVGLLYRVAERELELLSEVRIDETGDGAPLERITADAARIHPDGPLMRFDGYEALMSAGERLSGVGLTLEFEKTGGSSVLRKLMTDGGFQATAPVQMEPGDPLAAGPPASGTREMSGRSMEILFDAGKRMDHLVIEGSARASFTESGGSPRRLAGDSVHVKFRDGTASAVGARGSSSLEVPSTDPASDRPATLKAEAIDAVLDPETGGLAALEAAGDASIEDGQRRIHADRIDYSAPNELWSVRGSSDRPARAIGEGMTISSIEMEISRAEERLLARHEVKTAAERVAPAAPAPDPAAAPGPEPKPGAGGFFDGGGPIHGMSESLEIRQRGSAAYYRGQVRLWREGSSLEADEIDVFQDKGDLQARGGVVARVPSKRSEAGTTSTVTISSQQMSYSRESGLADFAGRATALSDDIRIEAARFELTSGEEGQLRKLKATGDVQLIQGSRTGECDELHADFDADRFILFGRGRLATIEDKSSQQVAKGAVLTFDRAADRILVESETGGRTWVTLEPRPGKGKKGDPVSPR